MPEWTDIINPLWWLQRPQQAVFQGAQAGGDAFGRYTSELRNRGVNPYSAPLYGAALSGIDATKGFVKGLTGYGEHVSGEDLVRGGKYGEAPTAGTGALGGFLEATADPMTPLMGAIGKPLGTAVRTAKSLRQTAETAPGTYAKLNPMGWKKWLLDIPTAPRTATEPLPIRTTPEAGGPWGVWPEIFGTAPQSQERALKTLGLYRDKILGYLASKAEGTVPHELIHWARDTLPPEMQATMNAALAHLSKLNPKGSGVLTKAGYPDIPARIGEELLARRWSQIPEGHPLYPIVQRAREAFQPTMTQAAPRLPLENIPIYARLAQGED